jgi:DNA topoisomerase III
MKVCIAEKPSVAKEIANVLGAKVKKDGYFEGNGYQVTWTFGHLCTLKEPHDYDGAWKYWKLESLPINPKKFDIKVLSDKGVQKQFKTIAYLVSNASEVINCGDAGQEGELIQRWVLKLANNTKPLKRLWISSLTEEAIKEGFKKLREGSEFDRLFYAGNSRAIGDWLLGMNATRLYTLKYGQNKQVLSIGRVQTPTLALIVNRQLEILNFKPQTYWELKTKYREVLFSAVKGKFNMKEEAENALTEITGAPFIITGFETKKGKEAPPRLFDLTSLQVECNKRFGFSADDTLKTVQVLYEKKYVTYPRVDTTYLSNDLFPKVPGILQGLAAYSHLTKPLLEKPIKKSGKVFNDNKVTDHHAIIPTGVAASGLNTYEAKVYDAIARRFIAAFYPDCEFASTVVNGEAKEIEFKATGKQILSEGWRVVFQKESISNEEEQEESQILPAFTKGESGPHEPNLAEKQTQPPKPFTEATLLRAMETAGKQVEDEELREAMKDNGIGRPSTRAAIIETLFKRNYIRKERKNLVATPTGVGLISVIKNELLKSAELTGQWEYKLRQIEKGEYDFVVFLNEMRQMVTSLVMQVVQEKAGGLPVIQKGPPKCPKCNQGELVKGKTAIGCRNFAECGFKLPFEISGFLLNDNQLLDLIEKNTIKAKNSNTAGIITLGEDFKPTFSEEVNETPKVKKPVKEKAPKIDINLEALPCPKCKGKGLLKGSTAYGCSGWKSGCNFRIPLQFLGKDLSLEELGLLVTKGETKAIKGLKLEDGSNANGKFFLNESLTIAFKTK